MNLEHSKYLLLLIIIIYFFVLLYFLFFFSLKEKKENNLLNILSTKKNEFIEILDSKNYPPLKKEEIKALKKFLLQIAFISDEDTKKKISEIYHFYNILREDFNILVKKKYSFKWAESFHEIITLNIHLPDYFIENLLNNKNIYIKFACIEYLITQKNRNSFKLINQFFNSKITQEKQEFLNYISILLLKTHYPFILEKDLEDASFFFQKAIVHAMGHIYSPSFSHWLYQNFDKFEPDLYLSSLYKHNSPLFLKLYEELSSHSSGDVRILVCKCLENLEICEDSIKILVKLISDGSYSVQIKALEIIRKLKIEEKISQQITTKHPHYLTLFEVFK